MLFRPLSRVVRGLAGSAAGHSRLRVVGRPLRALPGIACSVSGLAFSTGRVIVATVNGVGRLDQRDGHPEDASSSEPSSRSMGASEDAALDPEDASGRGDPESASALPSDGARASLPGDPSSQQPEIGIPSTHWVWPTASAVASLVVVILAIAIGLQLAEEDPSPPSAAGVRIRSVSIPRGVGDSDDPPLTPASRTVDAYRGYGAWVDVFDYSPPYAGSAPAITPEDLEQMAAYGVDTLYLQAARSDSRSPDGIQNRWLLAEMLIGAHRRGMAVVAWYLPRWHTDGRDLERMRLLDTFEAFGHRFDGVAVDIEWNEDGLTPSDRSARLVAFSRLAAERSDGPLGAIVLPAVQIEVVNPSYWPGFPWGDLSALYEVWLPMSYWTFRSGEYGDGYAYHEESVRRMRANLGDETALVHGVGGIGGVHEPGAIDTQEPLATVEEIDAFMRALRDTESIGGSIYDWRTTTPQVRAELSEHFAALYGG